MTIEVNNESGAEIDEAGLVALSRFVLDAMEIDPLADLSLVLLDPEAMAALHQQWMDLPGATDVMAFPMDGPEGPTERFDPSASPAGASVPLEPMLGDVVLCPAVAADQASSAGHTLTAEMHLLCTHGILHLLGYDHAEPDEEREMFDLQARLVGEWSRRSGVGPIRAPRPGTAGEQRDIAR
ncbi:MAG: rRNA maturation RNase YbeY [Jatrophihabitans sp.]|nr:MAG: rRNA maturation RNase YbeY [Jatrophihabitans sp.]